MRLFSCVALALGIVCGSGAQNFIGPLPKERILPDNVYKKPDHAVPGLVLIKYKVPQAIAIAAEAQTAKAVRKAKASGLAFQARIGSSGWILYRTSTMVDPVAFARQVVTTEPGAILASPVNTVRALVPEPNDPDYNAIEDREEYILNFSEEPASFQRCWHFNEINALAAWSDFPNTYYTAATKPVNVPTIAVIDTGLDMNHPDFRNAGGTTTDVSGGGQIIHSLSARVRLGDVVPNGSVNDDNGHGTHVAGLALASANNGGLNGHGTLGSGYACKGFIINVLDANGSGLDSDVAASIYYAVDSGADIISLSLGGEQFNPIMQDAVTYATEKGCVVVCAGNEDGNGGGDLGPIYPAACSGSLAVTANGPDATFASYAGYGQYVDVGAPGGDFVQEGTIGGTDFVLKLQFDWSTATMGTNYIIDNNLASPPYTTEYSYLAGTSMATPIVSGGIGHFMMKYNLRAGNWNNIRAYRAVQRAAGSQGAPNGGYELSNGYGYFDMQALMSESNARNALIGGAEGIVYFGGTATANVAVRAQKLNASGVPSGTIYGTATNANGYYRFDGMPVGRYQCWAIANGARRDTWVNVIPGSDRSGTDFYCGPAVVDSNPPTVVRCNVTSASSTGITVDHFAYDTETRLNKITFEIKNASNATVVPETLILPESRFTSLPATLANGSYTLVARYTNGEQMVTTCNVPFTVGTSTANVSGTLTLLNYTGTVPRAMTLQFRNPGTTTVVQSHNFNAINGTTFTVPTTLRGNYDIAIKGAHFLRGVIPNVNITNAGVSGLTLSLKNGDVNGDNVVGTSDFNAFRAAFGSTSTGGANWNLMADLNGDNSVGSVDFNILRAFFGQSGTP